MPITPQPTSQRSTAPLVKTTAATPAPITGTANAVDLCTSQYAANILSAGGVTLTTAQNLVLPSLITAASREIIRYCGRQFGQVTYNEILTPEGTRQDRGEPASVALSYFPVQSVTSVMTGRATVLTVSNTDQTTNQVASVAFAVSGDVEYNDLLYTGLNLTRTASGTTTTASVDFTTYATVQAVANQINTLGSGWKATVASGSTPAPGSFPSASLVGAREPKNAFSPGACLDLFTTPASTYDIDRATGILRVYGWGAGGTLGWGWGGAVGDPFGVPWDGLGGYGGGALGWNQYRVQYVAGWPTIPEDVQQVCAEVVKLMLARLLSDPSLKSENTGNYSWVAKDALGNLSADARRTLSLRKDNWI